MRLEWIKPPGKEKALRRKDGSQGRRKKIEKVFSYGTLAGWRMQWETEAGDPGHFWSLAWNFLEGKLEEYPGAYLMRPLACLGDNSEKVKSTISPGEKEAAFQPRWDRQE